MKRLCAWGLVAGIAASLLIGCGKSETEALIEQAQKDAIEAQKRHQELMEKNNQEMESQLANMKEGIQQRQQAREDAARQYAEYERAASAYNEGRLDQSAEILQPLADVGNEDAQRLLTKITKQRENQERVMASAKQELALAEQADAELARVMALPELEASEAVSTLFLGKTVTYQIGVGNNKGKNVRYIDAWENYVEFRKFGNTWIDQSSSYESQVDRGLFRVKGNQICFLSKFHDEICYGIKVDSAKAYFLVPTNKIRTSTTADTKRVTPSILKITEIAPGNIYQFRIEGGNVVMD